MVTYIFIGLLAVYCISLHAQINKLKYTAKYGSPRSESNIKILWEENEILKEKLSDHSSRLWEVEHKAGMHPPHVFV